MSREMAYQVRMAAEEPPEDVVTVLSRSVWTALRQVKALRNPDPRRWPDLRRDFSDVFKNRLRFYKGCGTQLECRYSLGIYGGRPDGQTPSGPTFILLLRGGLLRFVEGLSALACRRFRRGSGRELLPSRACREQIQGAVHRALAPYLYYNEGCFHCRVRQ